MIFRIPLIAAVVLLGASIASLKAQNVSTADLEFRDFTGANGKIIQAVLIDKTDAEATLVLKNGQRVTIPHDTLSEGDQQYVREWNKDKAVFLQQCRSLSVRHLLELRGYESFKFRIEGNSIMVDGELNGKKVKYCIDTGAGATLFHVDSAKEAGCEVGPMDQKIFGLGVELPAAWTEVKEIRMGESVIKDQRLLSADLRKNVESSSSGRYDALFGADFLSQLHAVISYREGRVFLRPDLAEGESETEEQPDFRLFKMSDGTIHKGNVLKKTGSAFTLTLENGKELQLGVSRLSPEDQEYVANWTPEADTFMRHCRGLTVEDLLELRSYESFEYDRRGNHIFVDGKLNEVETTFLIDTGADLSLLHIENAKESNCEIGPMSEKILALGTEVPAAVTKVKSIQMGQALIENRSVLATDIFKGQPQRGDYGAVFGADFLRELDGVITYRESRIFLRQD